MGQWMTQERKSAVVLIAEDDQEMRSLLCDELYDLGVSIREAADGDEALRLVLDARPSLILTDLRMPAGGLDYIARLRTFAPGCRWFCSPHLEIPRRKPMPWPSASRRTSISRFASASSKEPYGVS